MTEEWGMVTMVDGPEGGVMGGRIEVESRLAQPRFLVAGQLGRSLDVRADRKRPT